MSKRYDVIIIGAGPAGCSAATFLAKSGHGVLLVDKASFPRDKVCGDAISPPALAVLDRMGMSEKLAGKKPWRSDGFKIYSPEGKYVRAAFPSDKESKRHGYVMPRKDLDFLLFQHVQKIPNVDVMEKCEVKDLACPGGTTCTIKVSHENLTSEFTGNVVVGADGVHSIVARRKPCWNKTAGNTVLAVRAYFENVDGLENHIETFWERSLLPFYLWVFPTGEGTANVGLGVSDGFARREAVKEQLKVLMAENRYLGEKLGRARIIGDSLKGWPISFWPCFSKRSHRNVLLVGDAGGFADPVTGEGIYHALKSGECAAKAIDMALNSGGNTNSVGEIYEKIWKKELRPREYVIGRFIHKFFLSRRSFINFNVRRAIKRPSMAKTLAGILCQERSKIRLLF